MALFNGILLGLALGIMMGPILISLLQAGIERGIRAGLSVGIGIWISDFLFIGGVIYGLTYIKALIEFENFELYLGIAGGIVLIIVGVATLVSKPPDLLNLQPGNMKMATLLNYMVKGFLINSINPFTVFFWSSVLTTYLAGENSTSELIQFVGGIMGAVMISDVVKVVLAKKIRNNLKHKYILGTRRISGIALIVFGIVLFVRVLI